MGFIEDLKPEYFSVKEAVCPFVKVPNVDVLLGPEMRSTGEVMGIDPVFERAYAKSQLAAGTRLPASGLAFISVKDSDKAAGAGIALNLHRLGFKIVATTGTAH